MISIKILVNYNMQKNVTGNVHVCMCVCVYLRGRDGRRGEKLKPRQIQNEVSKKRGV